MWSNGCKLTVALAVLTVGWATELQVDARSTEVKNVRESTKAPVRGLESGEDACEGHSYDYEACKAVGCCGWAEVSYSDGSYCWSAVGNTTCDGTNAYWGSDDDDDDYITKINNSSESEKIVAVVFLSIGILLVVGGTIAALRLEKFKTLAKTYCCLFPCAMTMAVVVVLALGLHIIFFGVLVRRGVLWRSVSSRGLTFFLVLLLHNCF